MRRQRWEEKPIMVVCRSTEDYYIRAILVESALRLWWVFRCSTCSLVEKIFGV
ncbi:hypothetical protein ACLOJK_035845 [Asimina triloba]